MPLLSSTFSPPLLLRSPHTQTISPAIFRRPTIPAVETFNLDTPDGDILSYRLFTRGWKRLAIISHGLEGSYDSSYVRGMVLSLTAAQWDSLCWNMRGCGGTPNRLPTWYHSGKSDDLKLIINHALTFGYDEVALVGFSVGGNITLKYLGEEHASVPSSISRAVVISVPMDLKGSADTLALSKNSIYMNYLLRPLRQRMRQKQLQFPEMFSIHGLDSIRTFREFDERFTAPLHGFTSVDEYWSRSSSINYLTSVSIPTLALTAVDDPFLSPSCSPHSIAEGHPYLHLETPRHGGHVGFISSLNLSTTWAETRTLQFLENAK